MQKSVYLPWLVVVASAMDIRLAICDGTKCGKMYVGITKIVLKITLTIEKIAFVNSLDFSTASLNVTLVLPLLFAL